MKEMYLSPVLSHLEEVLSGCLELFEKNSMLLLLLFILLGVLTRGLNTRSVPSPPQDGRSYQRQLMGLQEELMGRVQEAGKARC